jgi:hypothetical protein
MKKKITLVCIAKDEDLYLQDWIDYHLKLGFDDIHIYQNEWRFQTNKENPLVHFHEYDGFSNVDPVTLIPIGNLWESNLQAKLYTEFAKNFHEQYEFAAFFDVDEFLVLKKHNNIKEFISDYSTVDCLIINWRFFGDNGLSEYDNRSVIERFTKTTNNVHPQFKSICKLHPDMKHQIHWVFGSWTDLSFHRGNDPFNYLGNYEIAQLNHYFCKTMPEFLKKLDRGGDMVGPKSRRPVSDYYTVNFNEVEDLTALNFFKNN